MASSLKNFPIGNFVGKLPGGWQREGVVDNGLVEQLNFPDNQHTHLHSQKYNSQSQLAFYQKIDSAIVRIDFSITDVNLAIAAYEQRDKETAERILSPLIHHLIAEEHYLPYDLAA